MKLNLQQKPFRSSNANMDLAKWTQPEASIALFGQGDVWTILPSPDGKYLAVATSIGLWWYELSTMSPLDLWDTEQGMISALSFSSNGRWIATGGRDGSVKVWDISSRDCITRVTRCEDGHSMRQKDISRVAFSPNSQLLALSGKRDYIVDLWNPETGEQLGKINGDSQIELQYCGLTRPIAFSPDSQLLACLSPSVRNNSGSPSIAAEFISVWDLSCYERLTILEKYPPGSGWHSFCFSPCGNYFVASGDVDKKLQIWDTEDWQPIRTQPWPGANWIIPSYSTQGVLHGAEVSDDNKTVTLFDIEHDRKLWTYPTSVDFSTISFSHGNQLVVKSGLELKTWIGKQNTPKTCPHTHLTPVESLAFSADGNTLACAYSYDGILIWNVDTPSHPQRVFRPPGVKHQVCAFYNGEFHTICVDKNTIKVSAIGSETLSAEIILENRPPYWAFAFAPETKRLASGDNKGTVSLWDVTNGERLYTSRKHPTEILRLAFSPNGKFLASQAAVGPDTRLWDVESGQEILGFPGTRIEKLAFSPCSTRIAADTKKEILVWDLLYSEIKLTLPKTSEWTDNGFWQTSFAFSPDSQYLASGGCEDLGGMKTPVRLWELTTGRNLATLRGHTRDVSALSFSPDGTLLASGSYDGTLRLWDVKRYL